MRNVIKDLLSLNRSALTIMNKMSLCQREEFKINK